MIDVSAVLTDPELGATGFTIIRTQYRRNKGELVPETRRIVTAGVIHPGTPEMMQLLPAEEKTDELIAIYTSSMLTTGENDGEARFAAPDRIEYKGKQWRIVRVRDWSAFNYYQALAVLMKEETIQNDEQQESEQSG